MARRPAAKRTTKKATNGAPKRATRKAKTEAPEIHEDDLSNDQLHAKIIEFSRTLAKHDLTVKDATDARKAERDRARASLGKQALHKIKLYEELQSEEGQQRLVAKVEMQLQIARLANMPTRQLDIFDDTDRTPILEKAFLDGKTAGLSGDAASPPSPYNSGQAQQKWLSGHQAGYSEYLIAKKMSPDAARAHAAAH